MRFIKWLRSAPVVALVAASLLFAVAGVVMASSPSPPLKVCVPTAENKSIVTPKGGVCKTGYTLTEVGKEGPEGKTGPAGQAGPEGKEGKQGKQGPPGASGSSIVDRVSVTETVVSGRDGVFVPLTGGVWTQGAEEINQLVGGSITVTEPDFEHCSQNEGETPGGLAISLMLDGETLPTGTHIETNLEAFRPGPGEGPERTVTVHLRTVHGWEPEEAAMWLLEAPGVATTHRLEVGAVDTCGEHGGSEAAHFKIDAISGLDVVGIN